jgi:hypothetical protein
VLVQSKRWYWQEALIGPEISAQWPCGTAPWHGLVPHSVLCEISRSIFTCARDADEVIGHLPEFIPRWEASTGWVHLKENP